MNRNQLTNSVVQDIHVLWLVDKVQLFAHEDTLANLVRDNGLDIQLQFLQRIHLASPFYIIL